jgi:hypothetical protein
VTRINVSDATGLQPFLLNSARVLLFAAAALVGTPHGAVLAQPSASAEIDLEVLRQRFKRALALEERAKWAEAKAEFEEIGKLKMTAQVRFHIGLCEESLGQLATALEHYEAALQLAESDRSNNEDVLTTAPEHIAALEPRVPRVKLTVENEGTAEILLDGQAKGKAKRGVEFRLNPGDHRIEVVRPGKSNFVRKFSSEESSVLEFSIPESTAVVSDATETKAPAPKLLTETEPGNPVPAIVVGAGGLSLLVASGVFVGLWQAAISEVRATCNDQDQQCSPALASRVDDGKLYSGLAWGLGAAGVAMAATGAVLYFTLGQDSTVTRKAALRIGPANTTFTLQFD